MTMFIRAKRVSDPLDEAAKARLRGCCCSSSSVVSEHVDADPSFSDPIHPFLHIDDDESFTVDSTSDDNNNVDSDNSSSSKDDADAIRKLLDQWKKSEPFLRRLRTDVLAIAEAVESSGAAYRHTVMALLRDCGYNAGICRAQWESDSSGMTGGSYEYIDIVVTTTADRYVVDVDFAAEFELARSTEEYRKLLAAVPRVMVARAEDVKRAVGTMAAAAKRSMKKKGLEVPPWRKRRYMLAKWLGPYRRTVVAVLPAPSTIVAARGGMIECRTVGFGCATRTIRSGSCGWC